MELTSNEEKLITGGSFFICAGVLGSIYCDNCWLWAGAIVYGLINIAAVTVSLNDEFEHPSEDKSLHDLEGYETICKHFKHRG